MNTYKLLAPLINFESEVSEIKLGKGFVIRKPSEYDKHTINRLIEEWPTVKYGEFLLECVINTELPESKPGEYIIKGKPYIEKALTILRMYKEDVIGYNLIVQPYGKGESYAYSAVPLKQYQLWINLETPDFYLSKQKYEIKKEGIERLNNFFLEFNVEGFETLNLAIDYFNKSYIEPFPPRDSFLDLMISLENLYLKEESLELGYRLSMRMSYILAKEVGKRKEVFKDIKKAYKYRGGIVHGGTSPNIDYEFLFKIREYVRESLKIFIKKPGLRDNLDKIILNGGY